MKNGIFKRIFGTLTAAVMCLTAVPKISASAANVGDKLTVQGGTTQHRGNCDGYSYEVWLDRTGGSGSMTLGKGATFKAEWDASVPSGNYLARRGLDFGSQKKATDYSYIGMDYAASYKQTNSANGNSRLCVYGWFQNKGVGGNVPLVEYYIIEDWVNWCPDGTGKMVTIDGAQYKIFQLDHTGPSINNGSETFKQYFSVRQSKRTSGHITVSDHFKAWAQQGWGIGNLYEVSLNAEGWQSSGYADVTKLDVYTTPNGGGGDGDITPTNPSVPSTPTVQPDSKGNYFSASFESGSDNWTGRGDASVKADSSNYYSGSKSLFVSGRTDNWHGASINLDPDAFVGGNTYSFSGAVLQKSGAATDMKLTLQYSLNGEENYDEVALASVKSGEWTKLENTSFKIPAGASDLVLYVEAPDSLTDFYIDDLQGSKEGVKSSVVTGQGTVSGNGQGQGQGDTPIVNPQPSGDSLKDKFANCFKLGTSVSPYELNSGASFIKKHFNSITPENELKPDSLLKQGSTDNTRCNVSLAGAAQTLKFCEDNGIAMRGHTFVWYSQTPDWFFKENFQSSGAYVSKDIMNKRLENFIKDTFALIAKEYPNLNLYAYDVCNELFLNDGGGLRPGSNSNWTKVYGDNNDEFIINAFTYARQYAPAGCKLYINDYNEYIPAKTNDIYNIAMKLKGLGVIDGIGMQSHLATNYPSASVYKTGLEKFLSTGLDVQITELDIETKGNDNARAQLFQDVFQMAVDHADQISSFTVWGTHDDVSWRKGETPLLFGSNYTAKPDYEKVMSIDVSGVNPQNPTEAPQQQPTEAPQQQPSNSQPSLPTATLIGDANCDGVVTIADSTAILQYLGNPDKYKLSEKGLANADCYSVGSGITGADAVAIQQLDAGIIKSLPVGDAVATTTQKKTDVVTTIATQAVVATANISSNFDSSVGNWAGRGDASVALDSNNYYSGKSLYVSGRTDNWNGAAIELSTKDLVPGNSYSFSAAVLQKSGSSETMQMTLQYDVDGTTDYVQICDATCKSGEWTKIENTSFKIPAGASNMVVYVEAPDSLTDYYLDEVLIATEGTKSSVVTGKGTATAETVKPPVSSAGGVDISWIDPSKPMMAISFDDGTQQYGTRIVDAISKSGFHATFFYVGNWITDTNAVKHAYQTGMEVANHTTSHPHLPQLSSSQIRSEYDQTYNKLKNIIGAEPSKLMRLPYLESNATVQQSLYDVPLISCAIDTQDWNGASKDQIVNTIKSAMNNGSANGSIILCHESYESTAAAMEEIAPYAKAQGWQIVTISEMAAVKGKTLNGGQVYTKV